MERRAPRVVRVACIEARLGGVALQERSHSSLVIGLGGGVKCDGEPHRRRTIAHRRCALCVSASAAAAGKVQKENETI